METCASRNAELYIVRVFGVVCIALANFLLTVIVKDPATSGMAIGFLGLSVGMAYSCLFGGFDPSPKTIVTVLRQEASVRARSILRFIYPPEAIYLRKIVSYSSEERTVTGQFYVPMTPSYVSPPIPYVSAEQYIRCLFQLSYALVGLLIQDGIIGFASFEMFKRLMTNYKMWFRRSDLRYVKNTLKEAEFEISLTLKKVDTLRVFSVCILEIGGVVRGELEFVAPLNNKG